MSKAGKVGEGDLGLLSFDMDFKVWKLLGNEQQCLSSGSHELVMIGFTPKAVWSFEISICHKLTFPVYR